MARTPSECNVLFLSDETAALKELANLDAAILHPAPKELAAFLNRFDRFIWPDTGVRLLLTSAPTKSK